MKKIATKKDVAAAKRGAATPLLPEEKTYSGSGNVLCVGPHIICSFPFAAQAVEAAKNLRAALKHEGYIAAGSLSVRLQEDES